MTDTPYRYRVAEGPPTRLVYDAWWFLFHDDPSLRRVGEPAAGMGIGVALLAELIVTGHLVLHPGPGEHTVTASRVQPTESLGLSLVELVRAEPKPLPVRQWLQYLAQTDIAGQVADRMATDRLLEARTRRTRLRRREVTEYVSLNPLQANAPVYWLRKWLELERPTEPTLTIAFLAVLAHKVGLGDDLCDGPVWAKRNADLADRWLAHLPSRAPLHLLLDHLEAALGAVATHRPY